MQKPCQAALDAKRSHTPVKGGIAPSQGVQDRGAGASLPITRSVPIGGWVVWSSAGGCGCTRRPTSRGLRVPTRRADGVSTAWGARQVNRASKNTKESKRGGVCLTDVHVVLQNG